MAAGLLDVSATIVLRMTVFKVMEDIVRAGWDSASYSGTKLVPFIKIPPCFFTKRSSDSYKPLTNFQISENLILTIFTSVLIVFMHFQESLLQSFKNIFPVVIYL